MGRHGITTVIGVPSFGMVSIYFMQAYKSQQFPLVSSTVDKIVLNKPIADARNEIVQFALDQDANYVYWLDDDVIAPPDSFLKLWRHQKDIINGVYWSKSNPPMPLLFRGHLEAPYLRWHCLLPQEKVQTDLGLIEISKISADFKVLTHTGKYQKINNIMRRSYTGTVYEIMPKKVRLPVKITAGHPIRVVKNLWKTDKSLGASKIYNRENFEYAWVNTEDLDKKNNGLVYPINQESISVVGVNKDRARLFGYFLSEGSLTGKLAGQIDFSFGYTDKELSYVEDVKTILKNEYNIDATISKAHVSSTRVRAYDKDLAQFLNDNFGRGAHGKYLPSWVITLPKDEQLEILKGMYWGDGNIKKNSGFIQYTTVSESMTTGLLQILLRFGSIPSISTSRTSIKSKQREGNKTYECKKIYVSNREISDALGWIVPTNEKQIGVIDGNNAILPIEYIKEIEYSGDVYNLEVDIDNSYVTRSFAVHNCGDLIEIDAAGSGLTLVKTDVYRKMEKDLGGPWYSVDYSSFPGVNQTPHNNTEDLYFYWKAKKAGYKIWADTSIQALHFDKTSNVMYTMPGNSPQAFPAWEIKPQGKKLIADIGSGPTTPYMADEGATVTFDIREDMHPDVVCDVRFLPVPSETFDIVFSSHTLEHFGWVGVDKVLKEWSRVLKVGGELRIVVPNLRHVAQRVLDDTMIPTDLWVLYGEQDYAKNFHAVGFTPNTLRGLVASLGIFEDIQIREGDFTGPPTPNAWNLQVKATKVKNIEIDNIAPEGVTKGPEDKSSYYPVRVYDQWNERVATPEEITADLTWLDAGDKAGLDRKTELLKSINGYAVTDSDKAYFSVDQLAAEEKQKEEPPKTTTIVKKRTTKKKE